MSATYSFGFTPLWALCLNLYGSFETYEQLQSIRELVAEEGLYAVHSLNPPLYLVKKTRDECETRELAQKLLETADDAGTAVLVMDHYRLVWSRHLNSALVLPMLEGLLLVTTTHLQRVHIVAEPEHVRPFRTLIEQARSNARTSTV